MSKCLFEKDFLILSDKCNPDPSNSSYNKLFNNQKFLKFVYRIYQLIDETKIGVANSAKLSLCKKYLSYFLQSNFYKWQYRTTELLKIKRLGVPSEHIYRLKYGNMWQEKWAALRSSLAMTLENQIKKYGVEEGTKRWNAYCKKQAETNTFEYKRKKYGISKEEFKAYNKSRATTLENMIAKYGPIDGPLKWEEYCNKQKDAGCSLNYFQRKYGVEKGSQVYQQINKLKQLNEANFIRKYGEAEGKIRYKRYLENQAKNTYVSKISQDFFDKLYKRLPQDVQKDCYYHNLNQEYVIYVKNKAYFYDFVIPSLKYCIEFNGDYWHANPALYTDSDLIRYPNNILVEAHEIWERDTNKILALEKTREYTVDIVWEMEYKNNTDLLVERFYERIMQRYRLGAD